MSPSLVHYIYSIFTTGSVTETIQQNRDLNTIQGQNSKMGDMDQFMTLTMWFCAISECLAALRAVYLRNSKLMAANSQTDI